MTRFKNIKLWSILTACFAVLYFFAQNDLKSLYKTFSNNLALIEEFKYFTTLLSSFCWKTLVISVFLTVLVIILFMVKYRKIKVINTKAAKETTKPRTLTLTEFQKDRISKALTELKDFLTSDVDPCIFDGLVISSWRKLVQKYGFEESIKKLEDFRTKKEILAQQLEKIQIANNIEFELVGVSCNPLVKSLLSLHHPIQVLYSPIYKLPKEAHDLDTMDAFKALSDQLGLAIEKTKNISKGLREDIEAAIRLISVRN